MRLFADLRDPMTGAEIEADIRLREEEDRRFREAHPLTLATLGRSVEIAGAAIRGGAGRKTHRWLKAMAAAWQEQQQALALAVPGGEGEAMQAGEDRLIEDLIAEREARAAAARDLFAALLALAKRTGTDPEGRLAPRWTALYPWLEEQR